MGSAVLFSVSMFLFELKLFIVDASFPENELLNKTPSTTEINKTINDPIIVSLLKSIPPNILFDIPKFKK